MRRLRLALLGIGYAMAAHETWRARAYRMEQGERVRRALTRTRPGRS